MENLKKNFEEPVVQIINMCFCENIATSGAITSCPANYDTPSINQTCKNCKVVYAASLEYPNKGIVLSYESIASYNYIKGNDDVKQFLKNYSSKKDISDQIPDVINKLQLKCPKYGL